LASRAQVVASEEFQYGPELDLEPAVASIGILVGAALLRLKINGAIAARERAEQAKRELQASRVQALSGDADVDLSMSEAVVERLVQEAEEARTIRILGLPMRVMVPLPLGSPAPGNSRPDGPGNVSRETGSLKKIITGVGLGMIVVAQLALFLLLATDPMSAPPSSLTDDHPPSMASIRTP